MDLYSSNEVRLATQCQTGKRVVIKCLALNRSIKRKHRALAECALLQMLNHNQVPYVVQYVEDFGVHVLSGGVDGSNTNHTHQFLVTRYVPGGTLYDWMDKMRTPMKTEHATKLFNQLLSCLTGAHKLGFAHRDLKPENLLLDEQGDLVVADWGYAEHMNQNGECTHRCGSPHFCAPEVMYETSFDGARADLFSAAAVFYNLLTGYTPLYVGKPLTLDPQKRTFPHLQMIPELLQDLVRNLLQPKPSNRIPPPCVQGHVALYIYDPEALDKSYMPPVAFSHAEIKTHTHEQHTRKLYQMVVMTCWSLSTIQQDLARYLEEGDTFQSPICTFYCRLP